MAIARLSMKVGKKGKAAPHAAYIARQGPYAGRLERGERLEAVEAGNMPAWAEHDPLRFWEAADEHERKNGSAYREMEIALPRELDPEQRGELVRDWVKQELGDRHAYQWAIHVPTASDGGEQPHVHLMFCERERDGIERDPDQYFKRYNRKHPERGGARKTNTGKPPAQRRAELAELRERWQVACNTALRKAGRTETIDMRSYAAQGREEQPEPKMAPGSWRAGGKARVMEFREARAEQLAAGRERHSLVPDPQGSLKESKERQELRAIGERLEEERRAKEEAERLAQIEADTKAAFAKARRELEAKKRAEERRRKAEAEKQERERLEALPLYELRKKVMDAQITAGEMVAGSAEMRQAEREEEDATKQAKREREELERGQEKMAEWRKNYRVRNWLHEHGFPAGKMSDSEKWEEHQKAKVQKAEKTVEQAKEHRQEVAERLWARAERQEAENRAELKKLAPILEKREAQEEERQKREREERRRKREAERKSKNRPRGRGR